MAELLDKILKQNPWWEKKRVDSIQGLEKRQLFNELLRYVDKKQILAVVGLRRVGKTVLLFQLIESLLAKTNAKRILYFSFDELLAKEPKIIEDTLATYENEILRQKLEKVYVFFDEINHIADWQVILKRFYDLDRGIKFIVSGSSSIQIEKAKESLAGRIYEFELKPLSFGEFLQLKNMKIQDMTIQSPTLKIEISKYLLKGGFPEIAKEDDFEMNKKYVGSIADKIIFSDMPKVYDIGNPEMLKEIFNIISRSPGSIVEYNNIASTLKLSYQTVSKYMHYLEKAYLIRSLYNFRGSPLATARKSKKIYLSTTAFALPALDAESDSILMMPKLAENAVVSHMNAKYFWREYFELDIIHNKQPIEVKYTDAFDLKNNIRAVKKLGLKKLIVVTKNIEKEGRQEGVSIKYVPLWKFLLTADEKAKSRI